MGRMNCGNNGASIVQAMAMMARVPISQSRNPNGLVMIQLMKLESCAPILFASMWLHGESRHHVAMGAG